MRNEESFEKILPISWKKLMENLRDFKTKIFRESQNFKIWEEKETKGEIFSLNNNNSLFKIISRISKIIFSLIL